MENLIPIDKFCNKMIKDCSINMNIFQKLKFYILLKFDYVWCKILINIVYRDYKIKK